jgi:hypothetical protein
MEGGESCSLFGGRQVKDLHYQVAEGKNLFLIDPLIWPS